MRSQSTCALLALLLFPLGALHAGEGEIIRDIKLLASDELEGRATGSPGGERAGRYVAAELEGVGLEPRLDAFDFLAGVRVVPAGTSLRFLVVDGPNEDEKLDESFRPLGFSANGRVSGDVVFAGYGITAPGGGYDDYGSLDVHGKLVLVLDGVPVPEAHRAAMGVGGMTRMKAYNAREHGALGMILVAREPSKGKEDDPSLIPLTDNTTHGDAGVPVVDLRRSAAVALFARAGLSLDELERAIDHEHAPRSRSLFGVRAEVSVDLVKERKRAANVIAIHRGSDPACAGQEILVGAHYDHLGRGEVPGSLAEDKERAGIHHGADDNASGTAALLEVARTLGKTRHDVVFAAFSGEELGLLGSAHLAKELFPEGRPAAVTVAAMVNMDMVGRLFGRKLTIGGMGTAAEWPDLVAAVAARDGIPFTAQEDGYGPSDHSSFYAKGVPVLFLFTGAHADYHKPSDTWEKIDVTGTARVAAFARDLVLAIDALEHAPKVQKTHDNPHGADLEPGRGPSVYFGTIPDYSETTTPGVRLTGVRPESPADKAGLRGGDIIVRFDGHEVRDIHEYTHALFSKKPGDRVKVVVKRGDAEVELEATLGRKGG